MEIASRCGKAMYILPIAKREWLLGHLDIKSVIQGNISQTRVLC